MKPSELKTFIPVESHDEKTAENYRNGYLAEKPIIFKLSKISIPYFDRTELDLSDDTIRIQNFHFSQKL